MPIITLTTDYGIKDHYAGIAKGKILSRLPDVQIVDISHCIDLYNIASASFVLLQAFSHFPKGTVHCVSVDAEVKDHTHFIAMEWEGHYFLAADNGALKLILDENQPQKLVRFESSSESFTTVDLYAETAKKIFANDWENWGTAISVDEMVTATELRPQIINDGNAIRGHIIYEDHYGNAITNVTHSLFKEVGKGRIFQFRATKYNISRINTHYADFANPNEAIGKELLLFNSESRLQLSVFKGNIGYAGSIRTLMGLSYRDSFIIEFKSNTID